MFLARITIDDKSDNNPSINPSSLSSREGSTVNNVLIHDIEKQSPENITIDDFNALWSGDIIAITRREKLGDSLQEKFDISWFIPLLIKYRKLFLQQWQQYLSETNP